MKIGIPKEIKNHEYRVGLTPGCVRELVALGHEVLVETDAGSGVSFFDQDYQAVGATIVQGPRQIFADSDLIVKVKEPQPEECRMLSPDQALFTFLHLAPDPEQTRLLKESGCAAIAYETITDDHGSLPILAPMSEVAGRMAIQAGAHCLEKNLGGLGMLMGGIPGVRPANVLVIGGGMVGTNAIRMAVGMEARVTVIDKSIHRLRELDAYFGSKLNTIYSTRDTLEEYVAKSDLVVGAVLLPGAAAPKLVTREMVKSMRQGSVIVDVAIDQGGCFETSRPTTHAKPTYMEEGVVHYCVTNMPGAVARTSTVGLNNVTLPYVIRLAERGVRNALLTDSHLRAGLNVYQGKITYKAVADTLGYEYFEPEQALQAAN